MEGSELKIKEFERIIANPFYCVEIAPSMCVPHETLVKPEVWVKAATNAIKEHGDNGEKFLTNLLENLKGNYV